MLYSNNMSLIELGKIQAHSGGIEQTNPDNAAEPGLHGSCSIMMMMVRGSSFWQYTEEL